jgi:YbgC/YbaW family acyl-CoA thioester hydrolase
MRYHETPLQVRFYEVDAYGVVWHGHYVGWFEAGRNDLTERFHLGPLQLKERDLLAPVVELTCQFKLPATFGDSLIVQTTMERTEVAKLIFHYRVLKEMKRFWHGSTTCPHRSQWNTSLSGSPEILEDRSHEKYLEV